MRLKTKNNEDIKNIGIRNIETNIAFERTKSWVLMKMHHQYLPLERERRKNVIRVLIFLKNEK